MVTARIFHAPDCIEILEFGSADRVTNKIIKTVFFCANCQLEIDNENKTVPILITTDNKGYIYLEATSIKLSANRIYINNKINGDYLRREYIASM